MSFSLSEAYAISLHDLLIQRQFASNDEQGGLHVPCLLGPTGIGKSRVSLDLAKELKLPAVVINCGECVDTTDVSGMLVPALTKQKKIGDQVLTALGWGLNPDLMRACEEGVLLIADDVDKAPEAVQGALLGLIGTRSVRGARLHHDTLILCAGNRQEDDAMAHMLSESLRGRLTIVEIKPTLRDFTNWASSGDVIAPEIVGFLQYKPEYLHMHHATAPRFPTPRGWEEASWDIKLLKGKPLLPKRANETLRLVVELRCGAPVAADFWAWHEHVRGVDVDGVLTGRAAVDAKDPLALYATIYAVATYLNDKGLKKSHIGFPAFVSALGSEHSTALLLQLGSTPRNQTQALFPDTAAKFMSGVL